MRIFPLGIPVLAAALSPALCLAQPVQAVSRADPSMISASGANFSFIQPHVSSVSADGRYVVFSSLSRNLVPGQAQTIEMGNVFLRDRVSGTTTLVSHALGSPSTTASSDSILSTISADGAYVAFISSATDLVAGTDSNGTFDVFLFERATGLVSLVSHVPGSSLVPANALSVNPVLSGDGRELAFMSRATDLVPGTDSNGKYDAFLYDRTTGNVTLVSHAAGAFSTASEGSGPVISRDGGYVSFLSPGTDLVPGSDTNNDLDVFLFQRATGLVTLASHAVAGPGAAGDSGSSAPLSISDDGGAVVFMSPATNLVVGTDGNAGYDIFVFERSTGSVGLVSHALGAPSTAGNGESFRPTLDGAGALVAFESRATDLVGGTDANGVSDVFLFERGTGTTILVSHAASSPTQAGNGISETPLLSASGQALSFASLASDLAAGGDANGLDDAFLYDRASGANVLASHALGAATTAASGESFDGSLSDDGQSLVFASTAHDLVPGDLNGPTGRDVFTFESSTGANDLVSAREASLPALTGSSYSSVSGGLTGVRRGSRMSGDGRFVAFQSYSVNLVPGQVTSEEGPQVFLFDSVTGAMTLVSHAPGLPSTTCGGSAGDPVLSRDGRYVAFESQADLIGSGPTPGAFQVFLYDRITGVTRLVSHALGAPATGGNGESDLSSISADGSRVGFASKASDLVSGLDSSLFDTFVFETSTGSVTLASHALGSPNDAANELSLGPVISADARFAAFTSYATDLVAGSDTNSLGDVFLFDSEMGIVTLVSHVDGSPGVAGNGPSGPASISDDGGYVAFESLASDLLPGVGPGNVFLFERATGGLALCSHAAGLPTTGGNSASFGAAISGSGTAVAFTSQATDLVPGSDLPNTRDVFVCDRASGLMALASHAPGDPGAAGNGESFQPSISGDGNSVAFEGDATNLVPGVDLNGSTDAFLYDRGTGVVRLVSHRPGFPTTAGNQLSFDSDGPIVSDAGAHVAFSSSASDLVPADYNAANDVFLLGPTGSTTADLAITKSDLQATAVAGQYLTYFITVTNPGPGAAFGAVVSDAPPAALPQPSWQCSGSGGAACYTPSGTGDLQVPADLPIGSTLSLAVSGYLDPTAAPGTLTNTASVALPAGYSDPNPSNNSATDTDTLIVQADLRTTQTDAPDPVRVGQDVTYSVEARNGGPSQAAGGTLTDTIPAGTTLVSTVPGPPTCTSAAGVVTCSFGTLPPDAATTLDVTVQTRVAGAITNVAQVSGTTPDPLAANDVSSESSLVVNRPPGELVHGSSEVRDLDPATSPTTGPDLYRLRQEAVSSYQVVVDAATGDIGSGAGPSLDRVGDDGVTVIQSSLPAGAGGSRSLAWQNAQTVVVDEEYVRVASAGCSPCGPQDTYRTQAWETTLRGARFNNSASQVTVLVLENSTASQVFGYTWFREGGGQISNFESFTVPPRGTFVLNTASVVPGLAGSLVVTHTAPYGGLGGKLVSVEPATGFAFDTPLVSRPR